MSEKGNPEPDSRSRFTFNAVKAALLLALVCIGINTYVLWSIYGSNNDSQDPIEASVSRYASQVETQMNRIEQKLYNIERSLSEQTNEQPLLDEILPRLEALDTLQLTLGNVEDNISTQEQILVEIEQLLLNIENKIDQDRSNLEARITVIEELLRTQSEDNELNDPNANWVSIFVERGDSIWDLASQFESPPSNQFITRIMELNNISDPRQLHVGQELVIPIN